VKLYQVVPKKLQLGRELGIDTKYGANGNDLKEVPFSPTEIQDEIDEKKAVLSQSQRTLAR